MAKKQLKTKNIPFDNKATELLPGVWEFMCGGLTWRWSDAGFGPNFGPVVGGEWQMSLFVKDIQQAGAFAEGYHAGKGFVQK